MSRASLTFADRLRTAREMRGLSQAQLADKAGLQPAAIAHFEAGRRSPSLKNLVGLAQALSISADHLVGLEHDQAAPTAPSARLGKLAGQLTAENLDLLEVMAKELIKRQ